MIKISALVLVVATLLFSCSEKNDTPVLNPGNLRSQLFTIDPLKDTTLTGLRGGIFKISKESFAGSKPVEIEIKEVYSPIEMLVAGLTTESNGRLLESGGMVYFNAGRNGDEIKLLKPVSVSIPTDYINKEMQLFKGEEKADRSVNWVDPIPLDSFTRLSAIDTGKVLFNTNCATCHGVFKEGTGPALAWVETRNDRDVLRKFIKNPAKVTAGNLYFQCLQNQYKSIMPAFPDMNREIDLILDYIKNEEAARPDLKTIANLKFTAADTISLLSCIAPCGYDTIYVDTTYNANIVANIQSSEATKDDTVDYLYQKPEPLEAQQRSAGFSDLIQTGGRYNFKIQTTGWFNVDAFYEGLKGTEFVDLFVKTDFEGLVDVHVFFPARKQLTVGVYHTEDQLYHFEKYKGQIPLYPDDEAVAIGITSVKEKIYYGITSFTVKREQTISLHIKETTKKELISAFQKMKLDGIDLDVITKKRLIVPNACADSSLGK